MKPFDRDQLSALLAPQQPPCVTITMPTAGRPPGSTGDGVRYGNLLRQVRTALEQRGVGDAGRAILARLEELGTGNGEGSPRAFWNTGARGIAVFASRDHFAFYRVGIELPEMTQVGDSYHVKPLLPLLYDDVRFHVLALHRSEVKLFEGNARGLHELPLDGVPKSMAEAVGREFDDAHQGASFHGSPDHSKGRTGGTGTAEGTGTHFHSYGQADRELDKDLERFFREVDRGIVEKYGQATRLPLVVVAVDKHLGQYRLLSKHPNLAPEGIAHDPAALTPSELHERALKLFEPQREDRLRAAIDAFGAAQPRGQAATDLSEIARAAVEGRVGRLLLETGREAWGRIDRATGALSHVAGPGDGADDLLDELAELTLQRGGEVLVLEPGRLASPTGVAAVYRY